MTRPIVSDPGNLNEAKLPRRDWILLPLLSMVTIGLTAGSTELIARRMFAVSKTELEQCFVLDDPSTGVRGIPNSTCQEKIPEGQLVEYRFNSHGHRAGMEPEPKPPNTFRIVMMGSSFAMGMQVESERSFAALLPQELSRPSGQKVEIYNEGMGHGFTHSAMLRFHEVLAAKPDMILWPLTPMDVKESSLVVPGREKHVGQGFWVRVSETLARESIWNEVRNPADVARNLWDIVSSGMRTHMQASQAGLMMDHFLYRSQSLYLNSYLRNGDSVAGFLKDESSAEWLNRLHQAESDIADVVAEAKAAGVPMVAVYIPDRAQAAMLSIGEWPVGYNPYRLANELRSAVTAHGGVYIDILPEYRNIPNPEQGYFPVEGHLNAKGHAIIVNLLAKGLTSGAVPALRIAAQPQSAHKNGQ